MRFRLLAVLVCAGALVFAAPGQAARSKTPPKAPPPMTADEVFVALRDAARANEPERAAALADRLPADYDLRSYVEYYRLRARMFEPGGAPRLDTPDDEIRAYLERYRGEAIADRLRNDWLLALGKQRNAPVFDDQYAQFVLKDDPQVACYAQGFRAQRLLTDRASIAGTPSTSAALRDWLAADARPLLRDARYYTDGCAWLIETYADAGVFTRDDLWQFVRNAYEQNVIAAGKRVARLIDGADTDAVERVAERNKEWLAQAEAKSLDMKTPARAPVAVLAVLRLGRTDTAAAARYFQRFAAQLPVADQAYVWAHLGAAAARRMEPDALGWFARADVAQADAALDDDTLAWRTRAALRAGEWTQVRKTIERMSADAQRDSTWVYWRGRALRAEGSREAGDALLAGIAAEPTFYGKLASEDLGVLQPLPQRAVPASADEIARASNNPGLQRALRFYALDLRFEGNREWNWQLRGMNDRQLLAVAEFARSQNVYDRVINTAERTRVEHDFSLRYLAPYDEVFAKQTADTGLDRAWVYGLVRQESRFSPKARSGVGAQGLMQVMPTTARWVARRIGLADYKPGVDDDIATNIMLGTHYLKMVYDDLDGSLVLASAAYNAGPGRSRQWRAALERPVEGAIFAESIPFTETRDYVKKVLTNAVYYAALFEGRPQSLKARLGLIAPKAAGPTTDMP